MSEKANILYEVTIQDTVTDNGLNSKGCFVSDTGLRDDSSLERETLSNKMVTELAEKLNAANSPEVPNRQSEIQLECDVTRKDTEPSYLGKNTKESLPLHEIDKSTASYGEMFNKEVFFNVYNQISSHNCTSDLNQNTQENESLKAVDSNTNTTQNIGETVSDKIDELKSEKPDECFEGQTNDFMKNLMCGNDFDINLTNELNIETVHNLNEDAKCNSFDNFKTVTESADRNENGNSSSNGNCKEKADMNVLSHSKCNSDIERDIDVICNIKHLSVVFNENRAMDNPVIENELGQDKHCENVTASNSTKGSKDFEKVDLKCESKDARSDVSSRNIEEVDLKCENKETQSDASNLNIEKVDLNCEKKAAQSEVSGQNFEKTDLKCENQEAYQVADVLNRNIEKVDLNCEKKAVQSEVSGQNFEKTDLEYENQEAYVADVSNQNIEEVDFKCKDTEAHSDVSSRNVEKVDLKCETKEAHSDVSSQNFESVASMESLDTSQLSQESYDSSKNEAEHNFTSSYSYRRALKYFQNLCDEHSPATIEKNSLYETRNQQEKFVELTTELQNTKKYFSNLQSDIFDLKKEIVKMKASIENLISTVRTSDEKNTVNN